MNSLFLPFSCNDHFSTIALSLTLPQHILRENACVVRVIAFMFCLRLLYSCLGLTSCQPISSNPSPHSSHFAPAVHMYLLSVCLLLLGWSWRVSSKRPEIKLLAYQTVSLYHINNIRALNKPLIIQCFSALRCHREQCEQWVLSPLNLHAYLVPGKERIGQKRGNRNRESKKG